MFATMFGEFRSKLIVGTEIVGESLRISFETRVNPLMKTDIILGYFGRLCTFVCS